MDERAAAVGTRTEVGSMRDRNCDASTQGYCRYLWALCPGDLVSRFLPKTLEQPKKTVPQRNLLVFPLSPLVQHFVGLGSAGQILTQCRHDQKSSEFCTSLNFKAFQVTCDTTLIYLSIIP